MCIGCGRRAAQGELVRFLLDEESSPPGVVRSSPGARTGRGAYLCADGGCLDLALRSKGFSRTFRRPVDIERNSLLDGLEEANRKPREKIGRLRDVAKRRIYEIAKDRGTSSKELAEKLQEAGLDVKSHLSSVEESEVEDALSSATVRKQKKEKPAGKPDKESAPSTKKPYARKKASKGMPTVAAPDVPIRKGIKPSGKVYRKGEEVEALAKQEAEAKEARQKAAEKKAAEKKAAAKTPAKSAEQPAQPKGGKSENGSVAAETPKSRKKSGDSKGSPAGRGKGSGASSRSRGGRDKSGRRRVVIDSQAGRKGGRAGRREAKKEASVHQEAIAIPEKPAPGVEEPVKLVNGATVKNIAEALELGSNEIIKTMMGLGEMVTITQSLPEETILILAEELERKVDIESTDDEEAKRREFHDEPADLEVRAPVVTIMGHVDHGKTSLLDAIRETEVTATEAGGITQHIGAYQVDHSDKAVTFIDTPGHEAFTAMRARGAEATDIAVIVVAANDGVMPQTIEAIDHAKEAGVPLTVAINKMDLEEGNKDREKKEWEEKGREKEEIRSNPTAPASGVIVEAELDVGRGPVATMLVKRGTLKVGDSIVSGNNYGKVRAMFDFRGDGIRKAVPGTPAQILGFGSVPTAGEFVEAVADERTARQMADKRAVRVRMEDLAKGKIAVASLEDFFDRVQEGAVKELALVIKGDVDGSVEALEEALTNVSHPEVKVRVVHSGVGAINESDIMLATASKAVVIGYNVRPSSAAKNLAENEGVEIRTHRVIYKAIEEVQAALVGMLEPEKVEEDLGMAEVREVFRSSKFGTIAGCHVSEGKITRSALLRVIRDGSIVFEGPVGSLRRFSDDAKEVLAGYECGLRVEGFDDIRVGDVIEAYEVKEVARTG